MHHRTPRIRRRALQVASVVLATLALSRQTPQFEISPQDVLLDEPLHIALAGLPPQQDVTILVDGNRGLWHSSATFRSDAQGRVEVADPMPAPARIRAAWPRAVTSSSPWRISMRKGCRRS